VSILRQECDSRNCLAATLVRFSDALREAARTCEELWRACMSFAMHRPPTGQNHNRNLVRRGSRLIRGPRLPLRRFTAPSPSDGAGLEFVLSVIPEQRATLLTADVDWNHRCADDQDPPILWGTRNI
jgi:hypothetical protein